MGRGQPEHSVQHSAEGSADSSTEGLHRPRRSCRQQTSAFIEEQLLEDLEERKLLTDRRTVRLKEKNKRAQQRFRERQKEKSQEAANQVQLLQKQVAELRSRAAAAQNRSQLLEKLLALRDGEGSINSTTPQATPSLQIFAPFDGFVALPEHDFVMQLRGCSPTAPVLIAKEQVQEMDLEQHSATWKAYIEKMAQALREADGNLQSSAAKHLQGLVDELCAWCVWVNQLSPHILAKMKSIPLDGTLTLTAPRPPHLLLNVLKRYGLSEEQTRQMVAARRFCLATLANLMRERLIMQETLQEVITGGSSWNNMNDSHLRMVEMQQRLAHNVEAESHAFHTFMTSALRRVLNPIQTSALLVAAFPFMPNIMSVVASLSGEEAGEGSDDDLLILDPVPLVMNPLPLAPADSLGMSLDALWSDIFLT